MTPPRALTCALAIVAALSLTGCRKTFDMPKVESVIKQRLTAAHVPVASVDCPDNVEVRKGETATCTVTSTKGRSRKVTFSVLDDSGRYTFALR